MMNQNWQRLGRILVLLALGATAVFLAACSPTGSEPAADGDMAEEMDMSESEHDDGHDHDDAAPAERVPNNGASVRIVSPQDGDTFSVGEQVIVEVEMENFDLGEEGNHWHVYIDGTSWGMVMGGNMDQPLTGLEPGEHEIAVFLSIETHEELEEGDAVTITVTE